VYPWESASDPIYQGEESADQFAGLTTRTRRFKCCVLPSVLFDQNFSDFQHMNTKQAIQKGGVEITPFESGKMMCCRLEV